MPRHKPDLSKETDILSKKGWTKPATLGQHLNKVTPKELQSIVNWGYERTHTLDTATIQNQNTKIVNLFYQYLKSGNEHGIRLITRATEKNFSLKGLHLFGVAPSAFYIDGKQIEDPEHPFMYALNNTPSMMKTLIEEGVKQNISNTSLCPYYIALKLHEAKSNLFDVIKATWNVFFTQSFKGCDPKNDNFQEKIKAILFKPEMLAELMTNKQTIPAAQLRPYEVAYALEQQGLDLYKEFDSFIEQEIPRQQGNWHLQLFGETKADKFVQLHQAFKKEAFWEAFTQADLSKCNPKSASLSDDVINVLFNQEGGLFKQMEEAFDKRRLGLLQPGTKDRFLEDLKSHIASTDHTAEPA